MTIHRALMCPYCGSGVRKTSSREVYTSLDDIDREFWVCARFPRCNSYVSCHPDGSPMGSLANKELRKARHNAHQSFDALWKAKMKRDGISKKKACDAAYSWLAAQMGIETSKCHIGMFDLDQCARVKEICRPFVKRAQEHLRRK